MRSEVVLVDFWASPFGMRVRIALAEKGVEYEFVEEDMRAADRSSLLQEMNPVKKIPVLIHNGKPICESMIIVQYIDEVWQDSPLLPRDPYARAFSRFWSDFIDRNVYGNVTGIWKNSGEALEASKKEFMETFKLIEGALGDKPYLGGESFGFLDVSLICFSPFFYVCEYFGSFNLEEELPKIAAWAKRCKERESVSKVLPEPIKAYELVCEARKSLGID